MTEKHPGGLRMTRRLIAQSGLSPAGEGENPVRVLDMGAGEGHTVRLLRDMGFDAQGIDLALPDGGFLLRGDFLRCPFPDGTFDAVISECAFYVSGDATAAMREAARILKNGGLLLLADVSFLDKKAHTRMLEDAGFSVLSLEDVTRDWKEYYISCIWDGTDQLLFPCVPKGKCHYYLTTGKKDALKL